MKTKPINLWNIALLSLLICTSCNDLNDPTQEDNIIEDSTPTPPVAAKGFFVANEDWFGHDEGTVNYFLKNGDNYDITYRAYRNANEGETLGTTTEFGTIWGDCIYLISKQGTRMVVADATTLKKKVSITDLQGDGRYFIGIDDQKGYVSTSNGIIVFDIAQLKTGNAIEGITGEIGNMCYANGKVFAVSSRKIYVIDAHTDQLIHTIEGSFNSMTQSKDGTIWGGGSDKLMKINPETLETTEIDYPDGQKMSNVWGAWNAGSFCASTQKNVLYWASGGGMFGGAKSIVQYNIDTNTANTNFYKLGISDEGQQLCFYGAGLRVDPLTDELILTVCHDGWGSSYLYNWIYKINNEGQEITHFGLKGNNGTAGEGEWYYWFPAIPFFEDANKPQILLNQISLAPGETKTINLNDKVVDYDNIQSTIQKSVEFANEDLFSKINLENGILTITAGNTTGETTCTIDVISNGVRITKTIQAIITANSKVQ